MEKKGSAAQPPGSFDLREIEAKNVSGSTAGAGSGDFHVYHKRRRQELERIEKMESDAKLKQEEDAILKEALERRMKEEKRTEKRAAKRKRKKELRANRKKSSTTRNEDKSTSSATMAEQDTSEKTKDAQHH